MCIYSITVVQPDFSTKRYSNEASDATITEDIITHIDFVLTEAPVADIVLIVSGHKVKGVHHADLAWTSDGIGQMEIFRDDSLIVTTNDDGDYTDNIRNKGGGSYDYQVCEQGTTNCSLVETLTF